jgi:2-dehydropantoate 2-reductase
MRILVVGVGAVGGYFGGRLLKAGRDVTFLVRPERAEILRKSGLSIKSRFGDLHLASPPTLIAKEIAGPFDLVLLSCKAYDLDDAIDSFAPAVGVGATILPLLNGMRHIEALSRRFGAARVIGGLCMISATRDAEGTILHLNDLHALVLGELEKGVSARVARIADTLSGAGFEARPSFDIRQDMWEKWVFLASAAAINCLMRGAIGDVVEAGAGELASALLDECADIAAANGHEPRADFMTRTRALLTARGSPMMASMLRDLEAGGRVEGDAVLGDLLKRAGGAKGEPRLLRIAYAHVRTYEARRRREATS